MAYMIETAEQELQMQLGVMLWQNIVLSNQLQSSERRVAELEKQLKEKE